MRRRKPSFFGQGWEWARAGHSLDAFPFADGTTEQQAEWIGLGYASYAAGEYEHLRAVT